MRIVRLFAAAAMLAAFAGHQPAEAAPLEFDMFFTMDSTFSADLGAAPLVGGGTVDPLPVPSTSIFMMARLGTPGTVYSDNYAFRAADAAQFSSSIMVGEVPDFPMIGMEEVTLSLYVDGDGDGIGGTGADTLVGSSSAGFALGGLNIGPGVNYVLQVSGSLLSTAIFGWYTGYINLESVVAAVPVPPSLLFALTAIGAVFGLAGMRRRRKTMA